MDAVAAIIGWTGQPGDAIETLTQLEDIQHVAAVTPGDILPPSHISKVFQAAELWSPAVIVEVLQWFSTTGATQLLWLSSPTPDVTIRGLRRLSACLRDTQAAMVYSDFLEVDDTAQLHPLIDYQLGSLRDDFDFGHMWLLDGTPLAELAGELRRDPAATRCGGWYELRLRLSAAGPVVHLPEPTYSVPALNSRGSGESHFHYVDPRNREYQVEMERIATAHLRRIGAYCEPPQASWVTEDGPFPVEASVVIPVKNRQRTVADAIRSALAQQTEFAFNVLVVDNHSDDGTTDIVSKIAQDDPRLVHLIPDRHDLGIGGCWNEAIYSRHCGRYAVQLDSDDLYAAPDVLQKIVNKFQSGPFAMVVGSYTIVDFELQPIPPGLVDHREWTDENGHNNALRIAGLGAPRAFHVPILRQIGFPNVSFGEDYAVALRIAGQHPIGRIYESLYWCRRWEDNTDHELPLVTKNRYAAYKDRIRSIEIATRQSRLR